MLPDSTRHGSDEWGKLVKSPLVSFSFGLSHDSFPFHLGGG